MDNINLKLFRAHALMNCISVTGAAPLIHNCSLTNTANCNYRATVLLTLAIHSILVASILYVCLSMIIFFILRSAVHLIMHASLQSRWIVYLMY